MFIDTFKTISSRFPETSGVLIGGGEYLNELKEYAKSIEIHDRLTFTDAISRKEVFEYLSRSKNLVHTSKFESFGMVFIEALAHGNRIISRQVGIADSSENWQIYNDENELESLIYNALTDDVMYLHKDDYNIKKVADAYLAFWRRNSPKSSPDSYIHQQNHKEG